MNIINGIARGLVPQSLALEERTLWERNTCEHDMYWCVYTVGERIQSFNL